MRSRGFLSLVALFGLFGIIGCDNGTSNTKATLNVVINTPSGVSLTPKVRVTGPSVDQNIDKSSTFSTAGTYSLKPQPILVGDYTYGDADQTVSLAGGETKTATVSYAAQTGALKVTVGITPAVTGFAVEVRKGTDLVQSITTAGDLNLSDLAPGDYQVVAKTAPTNYESSINGIKSQSQTITVEAGKSKTATVAFATGFGSASITLGAPSGISLTPNVALSGPSGFSRTLAALGSITIDGLAEGSYTLTPSAVLLGGIDYGASSTTFSVTKGQTTTRSLSYAATNSKITVIPTVGGVPSTDSLSVTLQPQSGSPTTKQGVGSISFEQLPFGSYTVSVTGIKAGTYIDQRVSYGPSAPIVTSVNNALLSQTANLLVDSQSGRLFIAGNGSKNNSGWTVGRFNSTRPCPYDGSIGTCPVEGTVNSSDGAFSLADGKVSSAASTDYVSLTSKSTSVLGEMAPIGAYRAEFDVTGNLYMVYQFIRNPANPTGAGLSSNRIVRVGKANLEAGRLSEGTNFDTALNGNYVNTIVSPDALGYRLGGGVNITDLAFDASGNLWMANNAGDAISCISRAQLSSGNDTISAPNRILIGSTTTNLIGPRALSFDNQGNLWVTGGRWAFQLANSGTYLLRIPKSFLDSTDGRCDGAPLSGTYATFARTSVSPDIRLDISQDTTPGGPIYQPSAMALTPDGSALWIADYGGGSDHSNGSTNNCPGGTLATDTDPYSKNNGSIDINTTRETVIKVPLSGSNTTPGTRTAIVTNRVTVGTFNRTPAPASMTTPPDRGMQQATGLAFDSRGNLWVATNNNVEVDPTNVCFANSTFVTGTQTQRDATCPSDPNTLQFDCSGPISRMRTDRRGKIYVIGKSDLGDRDPYTGGLYPSVAVAPVTPLLTLSGPAIGIGFTGLAINKPSP